MFDRKIADRHVWVEERLSAYMDDRLAPDEHTQVQNHLRDCARCQANLESLRWTVSLLRQAPAPALARSFTLPVTRKESRASGSGFAIFRMATAVATLLLCLVVGLDVFSQFRPSAAPAPAPAAQFAAPTQNIALAPQGANEQASAAVPTSVPTMAALAATLAPLPQPALSQPEALPTATRAQSVGAAELQATPAQADSAQKSSAPAPTQPFALRAAITATLTLTSSIPIQPRTAFTPTVIVVGTAPAQPPGPSGAIPPIVTRLRPTSTQLPPTATVPSATNTPAAEARTQPTREAFPSSVGTARAELPTLRLVEIGLLALAVALGVLTIVAWRRR